MSAAGGRGAGGAWALLVAGLAITVVALLAVGSASSGPPLDPRSDDRLGTSALVALARDLGAQVDIVHQVPTRAAEPNASDVVLLLDDRLDSDATDELLGWVDAGGTLVVTDPGSPLTPMWSGDIDGPDALGDALADQPLHCDIAPLAQLDLTAVAPRHGGILYGAPPGADTCLTIDREHPGVFGDGSYIVAEARGAGTIVSVGGAGMFVNAALAEGENAPVVAALVAPRADTHLMVLPAGLLADPSDEGDGLLALIPGGVVRLIVQLGIAFLIYVLWRARRLGRPVDEPRPVAVAASELVAATGSLLDRAGARAHAADVLRRDLHRELTTHLGVSRATPPGALAAVAAERTGIDADRVLAALAGPPVTDDAGLVALAHAIDLVREEALDHV